MVIHCQKVVIWVKVYQNDLKWLTLKNAFCTNNDRFVQPTQMAPTCALPWDHLLLKLSQVPPIVSPATFDMLQCTYILSVCFSYRKLTHMFQRSELLGFLNLKNDKKEKEFRNPWAKLIHLFYRHGPLAKPKNAPRQVTGRRPELYMCSEPRSKSAEHNWNADVPRIWLYMIIYDYYEYNSWLISIRI